MVKLNSSHFDFLTTESGVKTGHKINTLTVEDADAFYDIMNLLLKKDWKVQRQKEIVQKVSKIIKQAANAGREPNLEIVDEEFPIVL